MRTSFVIFAPEKERERLRESGVLPSHFFGDVDRLGEDGAPFCFWPYQLDYAAGDELAKSVREHPVHIPEFFGMRPTADVDARNLATDRVVKALRAVAVHIVFLDDDVNNGREDYVSFRSFADLTAWSSNLNEVLRVAFAQNRQLAAPENVLVLVARSACIKVTQEELDAFSGQVGEGRTFRSCYFLDHHLALGDGRDFAPSRDVWDLMVARLLHAFYLTCDGRTDRTVSKCWTVPGIKVWRASECVFSVDDKTAESTRRWIRSWIFDNVCNRLTDGDSPGDILGNIGTLDSARADLAREPLGFSAKDYWLNVDPVRFRSVLVDPRRAAKASAAISASISREHVRLRSMDGEKASSDLFASVHCDAGHVQPSLKAVSVEIAQRQEAMKGFGPEKEWSLVAAAERRRQQMIDDMSAGDEFTALKRHYIGWKLGFAVLVVVVSGYGLFSYLLLSRVLGAGVFYSILAGLSISAGAVAMLTLILIAHNRAGQRVVRNLFEYCEQVEGCAAERDEHIWNSVRMGMQRHMLFNQLARGARIKSLLRRLFTMLETELQGNDGIDVAGKPTVSVCENALRGRFRSASRHLVSYVPGRSVFEKRKIEALVGEMWRERDFKHGFARLWKRFCDFDVRNAGHFPATVMVPELRRFSSTIVETVYAEAIDQSIDPDSAATSKVFGEWMIALAAQNYYSGFSSEINATVVDPKCRCQSLFYLPRLESTVRHVAESASISFSSYPVAQILTENGTLAMAYEEVVVDLAIDADGGLVVPVEAKGASRG